MERFAQQMHDVQRLAEQQVRRMVPGEGPIQQSFLFHDGKFVGVRWTCENCRVEWAFGSAVVSVFLNDQSIAKIAMAAGVQRRAA